MERSKFNSLEGNDSLTAPAVLEGAVPASLFMNLFSFLALFPQEESYFYVHYRFCNHSDWMRFLWLFPHWSRTHHLHSTGLVWWGLESDFEETELQNNEFQFIPESKRIMTGIPKLWGVTLFPWLLGSWVAGFWQQCD